MAHKKWLWPWLFLLILSGLSPVLAESTPLPQLERATVNGMTILLQKTESELTEVTLLLKSGSGLDPFAKKGTAEVMNSLVYLRLKYGDAELGQIEVDTLPDYTLIRITTTTDNLETVLKELKDILTYPLYSYDTIRDLKGFYNTELKATPMLTKSYYDFTKEFYGKDHPYNNGLDPNVMVAITGHDIYRWYRQTYQPGNAVLSICGGVDRSIDQLEQFFQEMRTEAVDYRLLVTPVSLNQDQTLAREDPNGRVTSISIGFAAPRIQDPEYPAFRLLAYYLEEYQHYFEEVRVKEGLIYSEYVYYNYLQKPKAPNIVFLTMTDPQSLPLVEAKTLQVVNELVKDGITQTEIEKIIKAIKIENKMRAETGKGLATQNALSYYLQNQLVYDGVLMKKLESVKTEDIKRVAAKYFTHYIRVAYVPAQIENDL